MRLTPVSPDDPDNPFGSAAGSMDMAQDGPKPPKEPTLTPVSKDDPDNPFGSKDRSLGDALLTGAENLPGSFVSNVGSAGSALMHPINTIENLGRTAVGEFQSSGKNADMANAVNQFYKQRYGSWEGFKNAVAEDPFGVIMDLGTVVDPAAGGLAKAGIIGDRAATLARAATNPLYATTKGIGTVSGKFAPKIGNYAAEAAGVLSGTGGEAYKIAYNAAKSGGTDLAAFDKAFSKQDTAAATVGAARAGMDKITQEASDEFEKDAATVSDDAMPGAINSIDQAMTDMYNEIGPSAKSGIVKNPQAMEAFNEIKDTYDEWGRGLLKRGNLPTAAGVPGGVPSVWSLDELKQTVSRIAQKYKNAQNPQAQWAANTLASSIRQTIKSADYDSLMKNWGVSRDLLDEFNRTLSLQDGATIDTAIRKLQSALRDQVSTGFGQRKLLLDQLDDYAPGLKARVAGQTLQSPMPRGVARLGPIGAMLGLPFGIHGAGLGAAAGAAGELLMSSPKAGGQVARTLGLASRYASPYAKRALGATFGNPYTTRAAGVAGQPLATLSQSPFENDNQ